MKEDFKRAYYSGIESLKNFDYINARKWFEISYNDEEFREKSLYKLLQIDLKEGKYSKVRKLLEDNPDHQSIEIKKIYGLLESIENNYEASKKNYGLCMKEPEMQNPALLSIAKLYIQTGDNEVARKMLETLQLNQYFRSKSTMELIYLNILEENYEEAEKILRGINEHELAPTLYRYYYTASMYIKYFLGKLKPSDNHFDPISQYNFYRLFDNSDKVLLDHVQKHLNQEDRKSNGCFFKYTDLRKILLDVKKQIEKRNPNHCLLSDMYRFRLDTPIGFKGDEITNDICVVTRIGSKDILTMYPVLLSDKFDKEGFSTSKELMIKRNKGGIQR